MIYVTLVAEVVVCAWLALEWAHARSERDHANTMVDHWKGMYQIERDYATALEAENARATEAHGE